LSHVGGDGAANAAAARTAADQETCLLIATVVALSFPRNRLVVVLRARFWRFWVLPALVSWLVALFLIHTHLRGVDGQK
jgi:hypothetical protein